MEMDFLQIVDYKLTIHMSIEQFLKMALEAQEDYERETERIRSDFYTALESYKVCLEERAQALRNRSAHSQLVAIASAPEHERLMELIEKLSEIQQQYGTN